MGTRLASTMASGTPRAMVMVMVTVMVMVMVMLVGDLCMQC